ncbi:unnamed protein product [Peniophora sp. CBMAI 1063]|nr:unnamed protein product [Peniophora sp. CBMAI 1063]
MQLPGPSKEEVISGLHEYSDEDTSDSAQVVPTGRPPGYGNEDVTIPRRQHLAGFKGGRLILLEDNVPNYHATQKFRGSHRSMYLKIEGTWRECWPKDFEGKEEYLEWLAENPPELTASKKKSRARPPGLWKPIIERIEEWFGNYNQRINRISRSHAEDDTGLDIWKRYDAKQPAWRYYSKLFPAKLKDALDYQAYKTREEPKLKPGKKLLPYMAYFNLVPRSCTKERRWRFGTSLRKRSVYRNSAWRILRAMEDDGAMADDEDGVLGEPGVTRCLTVHDVLARRNNVTRASRQGPVVETVPEAVRKAVVARILQEKIAERELYVPCFIRVMRLRSQCLQRDSCYAKHPDPRSIPRQQVIWMAVLNDFWGSETIPERRDLSCVVHARSYPLLPPVLISAVRAYGGPDTDISFEDWDPTFFEQLEARWGQYCKAYFSVYNDDSTTFKTLTQYLDSERIARFGLGLVHQLPGLQDSEGDGGVAPGKTVISTASSPEPAASTSAAAQGGGTLLGAHRNVAALPTSSASGNALTQHRAFTGPSEHTNSRSELEMRKRKAPHVDSSSKKPHLSSKRLRGKKKRADQESDRDAMDTRSGQSSTDEHSSNQGMIGTTQVRSTKQRRMRGTHAAVATLLKSPSPAGSDYTTCNTHLPERAKPGGSGPTKAQMDAAWQVMHDWATNEDFTLPMCENALAAALGDHYQYSDWASVFDAVFIAEEEGRDPHSALDLDCHQKEANHKLLARDHDRASGDLRTRSLATLKDPAAWQILHDGVDNGLSFVALGSQLSKHLGDNRLMSAWDYIFDALLEDGRSKSTAHDTLLALEMDVLHQSALAESKRSGGRSLADLFMAPPLHAHSSSQDIEKAEHCAWDLVHLWVEGGFDMRLLEYELRLILGDHFNTEDWMPALDGVHNVGRGTLQVHVALDVLEMDSFNRPRLGKNRAPTAPTPLNVTQDRKEPKRIHSRPQHVSTESRSHDGPRLSDTPRSPEPEPDAPRSPEPEPDAPCSPEPEPELEPDAPRSLDGPRPLDAQCSPDTHRPSKARRSADGLRPLDVNGPLDAQHSPDVHRLSQARRSTDGSCLAGASSSACKPDPSRDPLPDMTPVNSIAPKSILAIPHPAEAAKFNYEDARFEDIVAHIRTMVGDDIEHDYTVRGLTALRKVTAHEQWQLLLRRWVSFEDQSQWFTTKFRPTQVPWWTKRHKVFKMISKLDVDTFGAAMRKCTETSEDASEDIWAPTCKGGENSIAILIIALSWWITEAKTAAQQRETVSMVEDLVFVLGQLIESE